MKLCSVPEVNLKIRILEISNCDTKYKHLCTKKTYFSYQYRVAIRQLLDKKRSNNNLNLILIIGRAENRCFFCLLSAKERLQFACDKNAGARKKALLSP